MFCLHVLIGCVFLDDLSVLLYTHTKDIEIFCFHVMTACVSSNSSSVLLYIDSNCILEINLHLMIACLLMLNQELPNWGIIEKYQNEIIFLILETLNKLWIMKRFLEWQRIDNSAILFYANDTDYKVFLINLSNPDQTPKLCNKL